MDLFRLLLPIGLIVGTVGALYILKYPRVGMVFIAVLAPVSNYITVGPIKVFYVIAALVLAGALYRQLSFSGLHLPKFVLLYGALTFGWITYSWVASGLSSTRLIAGLLGSAAIVCAVFILYDSVADVRNWTFAFATAVALSNVIVLLLALFYPPSRNLLFYVSGEGIRLQGTFGNPNIFGGAQVISFSIFFYFLINRIKGYQLISCLGALSTFGALLGAQSRSAILGLFIGIGAVGLFLIRNSNYPVRTLTGISVAGLLMIGVFFSLPSEIAGFELSRLGADAEAKLYSVGESAVIEERFYLYQAALETIAEHPLGIGYVSSEETAETIAKSSAQGVKKLPHNFILRHFIAFGLVGGGVMVLVWFYIPVAVTWKLWRRQLPSTSLAAMLLVGVVGYFIHNLFHSMTNWIYWWVFWGMCYRSAQLEDQRKR